MGQEMQAKKEKISMDEVNVQKEAAALQENEAQKVVIAVSKQSHSEYAVDWFLKHMMTGNFRITLVNVIPAPMDLEYFASLGTFTVPPLVYTEQHFEAIKEKVRFIYLKLTVILSFYM